MSTRLTLEQDIEIGRRYHSSSYRDICKELSHGHRQVLRVLQPKYLSWLLDYSLQMEGITLCANKHLQSEIKHMKRLIIASFFFGISAGISIALIIL